MVLQGARRVSCGAAGQLWLEGVWCCAITHAAVQSIGRWGQMVSGGNKDHASANGMEPVTRFAHRLNVCLQGAVGLGSRIFFGQDSRSSP